MQLNSDALNLIGTWEKEKMLDVSGQNFLSNVEGVRYKAYKDSGGVWTIGRGITYYPGGAKVKPGDTITKEQEQSYFLIIVAKYAENVNKQTPNCLTHNQFIALVSFCYNVGITAFNGSTLLKRVKANHNDPDIKNQFLRWVNDNGKKVQGLVNRRTKELNLYFTP